MTVTYTHTQAGNEAVAGGVWTDGAFSFGLSGGILGGLQFTIPAPDQLLFRSLILTVTPTFVGGAGTGTLTVGLVDDVNEAQFDDTTPNLPSTQTTIPIYSATETFSVGSPTSLTLNLGTVEPQPDQHVGQFESAMQVLGHSSFQGVVALVVTFSLAGAVICDLVTNPPTLVGDDVPFLSGLPSHKQMNSRADWCPRCGGPVFREELVKDGYTRNWVCTSCYDPPERRRRRWTPPKEINR